MLCVNRVCLSTNLAGFVMKYLSLIAMTGLMAGCSSLNSLLDTTNLVDYNNHKSVKVLEVPPGLDKPAFDATYVTNASDNIVIDQAVSLDDSVPLVDPSIGVPAASSMTIVKQGSQLALNVDNAEGGLFKNVTEALTSMGMTVIQSDEASGVLQVRDRSLVSSPDSPIGAFLNRTFGKVNKGTEYRALVKGGTVLFMDKDSAELPELESRSLLTRLKKELTT